MVCAGVASELQALEAKLSAGSKAAGDFTATKRVRAANTQHSAATTFLPTPAPFAHRRIRDITQTNSLDMALSHNAASTLVRQTLYLSLLHVAWLLQGRRGQE